MDAERERHQNTIAVKPTLDDSTTKLGGYHKVGPPLVTNGVATPIYEWPYEWVTGVFSPLFQWRIMSRDFSLVIRCLQVAAP